jgi:hypothetical protein
MGAPLNTIRFAFLGILFGGLCACSSSGNGGGSGGANGVSNTGTTYNLNGLVQKGPFVQGSTITIQELDNSLSPTGTTYLTQTTDFTGKFSIASNLKSPFVEIIASGYYYNEVTGALSDSTLTLRAYADIRVTPVVNVNVLTNLAHDRIKALVASGSTFGAAASQAQQEVLTVFKINSASLNDFSQMDISQSGDSNAALLACSAILQGSNSVAQLSELLAQLGSDIAANGAVSNTTNAALLVSNAAALNLTTIQSNLVARYLSFGVTATIPDFGSYVTAVVPSGGTCTTGNDGIPRDQYGRSCSADVLNYGCSGYTYNAQTGTYIDPATGQQFPASSCGGTTTIPNTGYYGNNYITGTGYGSGCDQWSQYYGITYVPVNLGGGQMVCVNYQYLQSQIMTTYPQYASTPYYNDPSYWYTYAPSAYSNGYSGGGYYGYGCGSGISLGLSSGGFSDGVSLCF